MKKWLQIKAKKKWVQHKHNSYNEGNKRAAGGGWKL